MHRVAVTGLGVVAPLGDSVETLIANLCAGRSGIGRLAFDAIQKSDLPIVQGTVLIAAAFVILMNLLVDILYAFLDPRVRY